MKVITRRDFVAHGVCALMLMVNAAGCLEVPEDLVLPPPPGEDNNEPNNVANNVVNNEPNNVVNNEPCELSCSPSVFCDGDVAVEQSAPGAITDDCECDFSAVEARTDCAADGRVCEEGQCLSVCEDVQCDPGERCIDGACADPCDGVMCEDMLVCVDGQCVDLCADVVCQGEARCEESVAVTFSGNGRCDPMTGECDFTDSENRTACDSAQLACRDGACVDLCEGVVCSSLCDGTVAVVFADGGQGCDIATGQCVETPTRTDCDAIQTLCFDGECVDLCEGVQCVDRSFCEGNTVVFIEAGECSFMTGTCSSGPDVREDCGDRLCVDGECQDAALGDLVLVSAATFVMGSQGGEPGRGSDETAHSVEITRDFLIMHREATQAQWANLMVIDPSFHTACGSDCPVESITWFEAVAFANQASAAEQRESCYVDPMDNTAYSIEDAEEQVIPELANGLDCLGYRLPTEAEWELAARGGVRTAFFNGEITSLDCGQVDPNLNAAGFFSCNSEGRVHETGLKLVNQFGLQDVHGNVKEWVWDRYANYAGDAVDPLGPVVGNERTLRGGSWKLDAGSCRAAKRFRVGPGTRENDAGVRLVRTAEP